MKNTSSSIFGYMVWIIFGFTLFSYSQSFAQATNSSNALIDVCMYWKKTGEYISFVESENGNLFSKLGHHGAGYSQVKVSGVKNNKRGISAKLQRNFFNSPRTLAIQNFPYHSKYN